MTKPKGGWTVGLRLLVKNRGPEREVLRVRVPKEKVADLVTAFVKLLTSRSLLR
jgi:hypothetical protein